METACPNKLGGACKNDAGERMSAMKRRVCLLVLSLAATPLHGALAQSGQIQGAWLEEGSTCTDVFVPTRNAIAFKRPANAFAPAFIISGQRLSTPLATCRLVGVNRSGERRILRLSCMTAITIDSARAIVSLGADGKLTRYHSAEGGIATEYQRCTRDALKAP
jgi:hypothetical protein